LLEEDESPKPSKHSGSVDGDPAMGDAQKCSDKRVTIHCNMQDVDSNIEIGMRNVFLTIVV
jgi:hypothetical protein